MSNYKGKMSSRLLAALLSTVMIFSMFPFSITVLAASDNHPDAVTITVIDEDENPIEGASVEITVDSVIHGDAYIHETKTTDDDGSVEVITKNSFVANDLSVTAKISVEGYKTDENTIKNMLITSEDQDFSVTLISTTINDVKISANSGLIYNGNPQSLISISGTKNGDTVIIKIDEDAEIQYEVGKDQEVKAEKTDADTYVVKVKVKREGYTDKVENLNVTIAKADIDIAITGKRVSYNEAEQDLVELTGNFTEGDTVQWFVDGKEKNIESGKVPQAMAVGSYSVQLVVTRKDNDNYNVFDKTVSAEIQLANLDLGSLNISANTLTYNGTAQKALTVEKQGRYNLQYSFDGTSAWTTFTDTTDYPTVKDAGDYTIYVKAIKDGYKDQQYPIYPISVKVAKADQDGFAFDNYIGTESSYELRGNIPYNKTYDFKATDTKTLADGSITYTLDDLSEDDIAVIDKDSGLLTVYYPGSITIIATLTGNKNYNDCIIKHKLDVKGVVETQGQYISFSKPNITYVLGTSDTISEQKATLNNDNIKGDITYYIETIPGISCDSDGKITVTNYNNLASEIRKAKGALNVTVKAIKAETDYYGEDSATYDIVIKFAETPNTPYKLNGTEGEINDQKTGWYTSNVKVTPSDAEKYTIAINTIGNFASEQTFNDQGEGNRCVYLKEKTTGGITDEIPVDIKIDTEKPDASNMNIKFSELNLIQKICNALGFYNPTVTITFTAEDITSGISHFNWIYTREEDASETNLDIDKGELTASDVGGVPTAILTLPSKTADQLRGNISFTATDKAGNESNSKKDDMVFVVDTISPTCSIKYAGAESYANAQQSVENTHYFNNDVDVALTITEANFYFEDVKVSVSKNGEDAVSVNPSWKDGDNVDENIGTFTLQGDGDYVVYVSYKDKSDNEMTEYTSEIITVDKIDPTIDFEFDRTNQKATVTIIEHNFRSSDVIVEVDAKDINNEAISVKDIQKYFQDYGNWINEGDTHTLVLKSGNGNILTDAIYNLKINFKDLALNEASEKQPDKFIIDHTAPDVSQIKIEYTDSLMDTVLNVITLGFYNPDVTVSFTAYDMVSGVDYFTWDYTCQTGASKTNLEADDGIVKAESDGDKATASIKLPRNQAEQLRGNIAITATDNYENTSKKLNDNNHVIIVDTISPTMTVEYPKEDRKVDSTAYYKKRSVDVKFTVTEANFFKDDVKITVTKNNGITYTVTPSWTDKNTDVHIGTYTLTGDGDYIINVKYTDRSANKMRSYTSHVITIDTIDPKIEVQYTNKDAVNTLKDSNGNKRKYFDKTQKAVVKITEHNFDAKEVDFNIIAEDVSGQKLNTKDLSKKSVWSVDSTGNVHTITITYPGDANYAFDVTYTDLATNKAKNYKPDYFTVDKTAPKNITVDYSTSVLDTVLESVTFGFYNAKMTVTLTADDITSGVHSFLYSYANADGVSSVNAELINQVIAAANISYSNGRKTATATFEIPKMILDNDNQFNGNVEFIASDRSSNESDSHKEAKRIVVDNIAPNAQVSYSDAVNVEDDISYYDGNINTTIAVNEANFYAQDVQVMVSKDGGEGTAVTPSWSNNSVDSHIGTFALTEDGDYFITINYKDKSSNAMTTYISKQLTIDTEIEKPVVTINGKNDNGKAYKNEVVPAVSFGDKNFDNYEITLTRTRYGNKNVDVTTKFIGNHVAVDEKGGSGTFDEFDKIAENDGIYIMNVKMTDKAGHSSEKTTTFTVNRFGSVYEYSDYLVSLIENGGAYVDSVTDDLIITEYNADRLVDESLNIEITCDGKPLDKVDYTVSPAISNKVVVGDSGWFQYQYNIKKANFAEDGVYKVSISSKDATGNSPENSNYDNKNILFRVDSTVPEITSIIGLEKSIINAQKVKVKYNVFDAIGLKDVKVFVNDNQVGKTIESFDADLNNYSGSFVINERSSAQKVRVVVEDLAGNITDTNSKNFNSAYEFNKSVTISTNIFVRWYANKLLFWGSICGVVIILFGVLWFVFAVKNKKNKQKNNLE